VRPPQRDQVRKPAAQRPHSDATSFTFHCDDVGPECSLLRLLLDVNSVALCHQIRDVHGASSFGMGAELRSH
jgi:hypothetical protein